MTLRHATPDDAAFLLRLRAAPGVADYLAVSARTRSELGAQLATADEGRSGWLVSARGGHDLAALKWTLVNRRSRIAELSDVMVEPDARRQGVGRSIVRAAAELLFDQHRIHRVQLEVYGDNHPAQRTFETAGFNREGVRRKAYWRRGAWQDGVLYGVLAGEDDH